jgi:hypothetical protein
LLTDGALRRSSGDDAFEDAPALLTVDTLVPYLHRAGVLEEATVAAGGLRSEGFHRRHQNLRLTRPDGTGFFVKQADPLAVGGRQSVAAEGRFYASMSLVRPELGGLAPELVRYDAPRGAVVLRLLADHRTLRELIAAEGDLRFPIRAWHRLGELLARVHRTTVGDPSPVRPFLETFDPAPAVLAGIGPAALRVFEVVQTSGLREGLASAADLWAPEAFVHGDVRIDNVMIARDATGDDVRLVDWELSGRGDPMWDLAGCLEAAITASWGRLGATELCLPVMQSAARASWQAYQAHGGVAPRDRSDSAIRVTMYAAARLVLAALESAERSRDLTGHAIGYLQVAHNILADPAAAATDLFALEGVA